MTRDELLDEIEDIDSQIAALEDERALLRQQLNAVDGVEKSRKRAAQALRNAWVSPLDVAAVRKLEAEAAPIAEEP